MSEDSYGLLSITRPRTYFKQRFGDSEAARIGHGLLAEVDNAYRELEKRHTRGKIVLGP